MARTKQSQRKSKSPQIVMKDGVEVTVVKEPQPPRKPKAVKVKVAKKPRKPKVVKVPDTCCVICQRPTWRTHACCKGAQCKPCWEHFLNSEGEFDKNMDVAVRCNMCQKQCSWNGRFVKF